MGFISLIQSGTSRGAQQIFGADGASIGGVGEPGGGEYTGGITWTPVDLLLKNVRWSLATALAAGKSAFIHFKKSNNVALGSALEIDDPATEASADLEQTAPAVDVSSLGTTQNYLNTWTTDPIGRFSIVATEYLCSLVPQLSFYQAGNDFADLVVGASDRFGTFNFVNNTGVSTTEAAVQTPWPTSGTFKRCVLVYKGSVATTVEVALRKNGADTALLFTLALTASFQGVVDLTTAVSVAEGDLLDWRFKRTAGAGTVLDLVIGLGMT
jgi:hypothetical protein